MLKGDGMEVKNLTIVFTDKSVINVDKASNFTIFGASSPFVYFAVGFGASATSHLIPLANIYKLTYVGAVLKL